MLHGLVKTVINVGGVSAIYYNYIPIPSPAACWNFCDRARTEPPRATLENPELPVLGMGDVS